LTNEGAKEVPNFTSILITAHIRVRSIRSTSIFTHNTAGIAESCWSNQWKSNGDKIVEDKKNPNGEDNYVWMEASGRGTFAGVTMSVLQNQDGWWAKAMICSLSTERKSVDYGTGQKIIFWVRSISVTTVFVRAIRRAVERRRTRWR